MKKYCIYGLLLAAITNPLAANAFEWNSLNIFKNKTKETKEIPTRYTPVTPKSAANSIQQLNNQIAALDTVTQNVFLSIVAALSSQDEVNFFRTKMVSILAEPTITEYERSNRMSSLMSSFAKSLLDNQSYVTSKISGMSNSQKASLIDNLAVLSKCSYNFTDISNQYSNILSGLSISRSNVSALANAAIKNSAKATKNKSESIENIVIQVSELVKANDINFILLNN